VYDNCLKKFDGVAGFAETNTEMLSTLKELSTGQLAKVPYFSLSPLSHHLKKGFSRRVIFVS
jgi:hypothetical protein